MASIKYNEKKGYYEVRYDAGRDGSGRRIQKYKGGFKREKDAKKFLAEVMNQVYNNSYIEPAKMYLFEYLNEWLEERKLHISPNTYNGYRTNIRCHINPYIGGIRLKDLKPAHIRKLYATL